MNARLLSWFALASLALGSVACVQPRTQVMAIVTADETIASDTTYLNILVLGGRGEALEERTMLQLAPTRWPVLVALAPLEGDVTRTYILEVTALDHRGNPIGRVRARSGFVPGKTKALPLFLSELCRESHETCAQDETCQAGRCVDFDVSSTSLPDYNPVGATDDEPRPDADTSRDGGQRPDGPELPRDGASESGIDGGPCFDPPCHIFCGLVDDACGGLVDCGECTNVGEVCGLRRPNVCDVPIPDCTPLSCELLGVQCGSAEDACGSTLDCGECPDGSRCRDGLCESCAGPLSPRACSSPADCPHSDDRCFGGFCIALCGRPESETRAATDDIIGGAMAVGRLCVSVGGLAARTRRRDGCEVHEVLSVVATSPTARDTRWHVSHWPANLREPRSVAQEDLSSFLVSRADEDTPIFGLGLAMSPDHEAIAIGYTMTSTPRAGEILFTRTSDRSTVRAPLVHDGFAWVDERRLLVRIGDPPRMHWAEFDGVTISLGAAAVRGLGRWTVGGSSGFDAGTGLVLLVGHPPTPTWPDGTGDIVTFVVPLSTLLARTEAGVALDAWADPEVTRLRNAQGGVVVGRRLVSMSSFGGLEVREIVSTSPPSFGPPRTIFVSTTHAIAALDDEHLVVEHAGTPWILRLAP